MSVHMLANINQFLRKPCSRRDPLPRKRCSRSDRYPGNSARAANQTEVCFWLLRVQDHSELLGAFAILHSIAYKTVRHRATHINLGVA